MMKHGWDNYVKYAWGKNELKPVSKRDHAGSVFGSFSLGATIVDSLDTLLIMGLNDEYNRGREWVANNFTLENVVSILISIIYFYSKYISMQWCIIQIFTKILISLLYLCPKH